MIVIGRFPYYLELGERLKAKVFNIPQSEWDTMTREQRWAINREFLDAAIAAGEQIILATAPEKVPLGSTLEMELEYLATYGYLPQTNRLCSTEGRNGISLGGKTVKDPRLESIGHTLKHWGFDCWDEIGPDAKHFGNWIILGYRDNLALRIIRDRGPVHLDLMPAALFHAHSSESDWYNWDVVASALGIPFRPEIEPLVSFRDHLDIVNHEFAPANWEGTRERLAQVEQEKRRRFTEGRREERRVPAHA
jgi:hypothetical protein